MECAGWEDKKKMASVINNSVIEDAFNVALKAGAITGKVSGADGGGYIMFIRTG
jgi:D-glycero-alpha-D-manno-heptose-7-phosphate kinase